MPPNRLIVGSCLGVLAASVGGAAARLPRLYPAGLRLELSCCESLAVPPARPVRPAAGAVRLAQIAADRHETPPMPNPADLSLQMIPDQSVIGVGTRISFRVRTRKPGYLMLVDIDANGRMSQIFPTPEMIVQSPEGAANFVKRGEELSIPNAAAQKRGFEFVTTPPTGEAAVVAILSDRRVQILDLPDNVQMPRSEAETIKSLIGWMNELRIPDSGTGKLVPADWSYDIRRYSIR